MFSGYRRSEFFGPNEGVDQIGGEAGCEQNANGEIERTHICSHPITYAIAIAKKTTVEIKAKKSPMAASWCIRHARCRKSAPGERVTLLNHRYVTNCSKCTMRIAAFAFRLAESNVLTELPPNYLRIPRNVKSRVPAVGGRFALLS